MCVCVRERESARAREREKGRKKARDRELHPIALGSNPPERGGVGGGREREKEREMEREGEISTLWLLGQTNPAFGGYLLGDMLVYIRVSLHVSADAKRPESAGHQPKTCVDVCQITH